jgi:hypothetical protein
LAGKAVPFKQACIVCWLFYPLQRNLPVPAKHTPVECLQLFENGYDLHHFSPPVKEIRYQERL